MANEKRLVYKLSGIYYPKGDLKIYKAFYNMLYNTTGTIVLHVMVNVDIIYKDLL